MAYEISDNVTGPCPPKMGFSAKRVDQVIAKHDASQEIAKDDLVLRIFVKHEHSWSDVVILQRNAKSQNVNFACRAFHDEITVDRSTSALELLKRFIDKFGMTFEVGTFQGKLLYNEQVPLAESEITEKKTARLFKLPTPNHDFISVVSFKIGKSHVDVSLGFFINTTKYSQSRAAH